MKEGMRFFKRASVLFVAMAIAVLLVALAIIEALGDQARPASDRPSTGYLRTFELALISEEVRTADWELRHAH